MARKTILITGCSAGGIGDALAQEFHRHGHRVFATARNISKMKHLQELGIETFSLDVVDPASVQNAVKTISAATGGTLDILVNNAGSGYSMTVLDSDVEVTRKMFEVNVFALLSMTKAFAPLLVKSKGLVVNIGSIVAVAPIPWRGVYNASKGAVHQLSDTMRLELQPLGVNVTLIVTGTVFSKFANNETVGQLPPDSLYSAGKELVETCLRGEYTPSNAINVEEYAEKAVKAVLKSKPAAHVWIGGSTGIVWVGATFLWTTAWDFLFDKSFGIAELRNILKKTKSKEV